MTSIGDNRLLAAGAGPCGGGYSRAMSDAIFHGWAHAGNPVKVEQTVSKARLSAGLLFATWKLQFAWADL
jgi:hypothetical protein